MAVSLITAPVVEARLPCSRVAPTSWASPPDPWSPAGNLTPGKVTSSHQQSPIRPGRVGFLLAVDLSKTDIFLLSKRYKKISHVGNLSYQSFLFRIFSSIDWVPTLLSIAGLPTGEISYINSV